MQTVTDFRNFTHSLKSDSLVNQVVSKEKIPPLALGAVLSICNNSNHPIFKNTAEVRDFTEAREHLESALIHLREAFPFLAKHPVEMRELKNAYAFASGYLFIITSTLDIPQNARLEKMLLAKEAEQLAFMRGGVKGGAK